MARHAGFAVARHRSSCRQPGSRRRHPAACDIVMYPFLQTLFADAGYQGPQFHNTLGSSARARVRISARRRRDETASTKKQSPPSDLRASNTLGTSTISKGRRPSCSATSRPQTSRRPSRRPSSISRSSRHCGTASRAAAVNCTQRRATPRHGAPGGSSILRVRSQTCRHRALPSLPIAAITCRASKGSMP
jgi:hypothetical protein